MTRAVLFDVDGTLVDTVGFHAEAWSRTCAEFGFDVSVDAVREQIGKGGDLLLPALIGAAAAAERQEAMEQRRGQLFTAEYLDRAQGIAGAAGLFRRLRGDGVRIALASSCKAEELEVYTRAAGVEGLYDAAVTADDVDRSKPFPDIFQAALKKVSAEPGEAVAVGDSVWDAKAAGAAGVPTIGVLTGGFQPRDLRDAGCVEVWESVGELLRNYDRSALRR